MGLLIVMVFTLLVVTALALFALSALEKERNAALAGRSIPPADRQQAQTGDRSDSPAPQAASRGRTK